MAVIWDRCGTETNRHPAAATNSAAKDPFTYGTQVARSIAM
jgi:hypothetical protein